MPSAAFARSTDRGLSQHPSTPVLAQLDAEMHVDPAGRLEFPVATKPSFTAMTRVPLSLPLNPAANPVPLEPLPLLSVRFPKPICQKTAEMFATSPLGSTT